MLYPVDPPGASEPVAAITVPTAGPEHPPADITVPPHDTPRHLEAVPAGPVARTGDAIVDAIADARDRHPCAGLAGDLDTYLAAVAAALQARGVITGVPQRTDSAAQLSGSIDIDCTGVRPGAGEPGPAQPHARHPLGGGAVEDSHPTPVLVAWDEDLGWRVDLHHDSISSSRRHHRHGDLLPPSSEVAEFVVALAQAQRRGDPDPAPATGSGPPRLRLLR